MKSEEALYCVPMNIYQINDLIDGLEYRYDLDDADQKLLTRLKTLQNQINNQKGE